MTTGPRRYPAFADGLRLAVTTFTIFTVRPAPPHPGSDASPDPAAAAVTETVRLSDPAHHAAGKHIAAADPTPAPEPDKTVEIRDSASGIRPEVAGAAMARAPFIGLGLGLLVGGLAIALRALSAPALVAGLVAVAALAGLTRGLHLDGLADTADGLGSYQPRERALAIMKSPEIGPFGVVTLVLALVIPAACVAGLLGRPWWAVLAALGAAVACGRTAVTWACREGVPAASATGLGALVAGTVKAPVPLVAGLATAAVSIAAVPNRLWQGPVAVTIGLGATVLLVRHVTRRLGGITGDVLGACVEIATVLTLIVLSLGS
jgi:adenosylcobinamide-GDP ribazoletransferase